MYSKDADAIVVVKFGMKSNANEKISALHKLIVLGSCLICFEEVMALFS